MDYYKFLSVCASLFLFETPEILNRFIRNVAECTKLGGYFVSTCYDGNLIFDALRDKGEGESISISKGQRKCGKYKNFTREMNFNRMKQV